MRLIHKVSGVRTLNETYSSLWRRAMMGLDYAVRRRGPLTMAPSQLGAFTRSSADQDRPNIQFHVQPLSLDKFGDPLHAFPAFTTSVANLRPQSRGNIRLRSADPADKPMIQPNYLSAYEDKRVAADSVRVARAIVSQPALQRFHPIEYLPGDSVRSDDETALIEAAGNIGTTIFHPVGTAKMGRKDDPLAVTNERLRVIGLENVRVADAVGDAGDYLRQYQFADDHDCGKSGDDDARRREIVEQGRVISQSRFFGFGGADESDRAHQEHHAQSGCRMAGDCARKR